MTEESLKSEGWKYIGQCHCNATLNLKYQKDDFIIYLMPKRHQFFIKKYNNKVHPVSPLRELEYAIKNIYTEA